jgi:hypothetical protein
LHILLFRLAFGLSDVTTWHFFLLFHNWCLSFPSQGCEKSHQKIHIHLRQYMGGDWEALEEEHTIKAFVLTPHKCLELIPDPTPPPLA